MPTSMIAVISSAVATGRRMKTRDGFTPGSASRRSSRRGAADGSLAAPPAIAARAFGLRMFGLRVFGHRRGTTLSVAPPRAALFGSGPFGSAAGSRDPHLGAVAQPVGAIDNDDLPRPHPV